MSRWVVGGVALICAFVGAWPVQAQVKGAPRLVFSTPPGCGSEATFRDAVAIFFDGADPFDPNALGVVRVTFTKIPGGYRGAVQYTPPKGDAWPTEEKIGPMCALIFQSVARVASMHVPDPPPKGATQPDAEQTRPGLVNALPEPKPSKGVAPWAPPPMAPENLQGPKPPPPSPQEDMDIAIGLSGFVLMSAGYTANVAPGFQLGAELRSEQDESDLFRLGLEIRGLVPGVAYARDRLDPKVTKRIPLDLDVSQLGAQLVPCVRWKYLLGCGVAQLNVAFVQTPLELGSQWSYAFGPRIGLEVPFAERFAVRAFGEALFTPRQVAVGFAEPPPGNEGAPNVFWAQSVGSGFFGVGLSVTFQ